MKVNFKKYIGIVLAVCLLMALVTLVACKEKEEETQPTTPAQTTPAETTPAETTPPETTPAETTVAFPSDEENDPKQEDVFFD